MEGETGRCINDGDARAPTRTARPVSCSWLQAADRRPCVTRAEDAGARLLVPVRPLSPAADDRARSIRVRCRRPAAVRGGERFFVTEQFSNCASQLNIKYIFRGKIWMIVFIEIIILTKKTGLFFTAVNKSTDSLLMWR